MSKSTQKTIGALLRAARVREGLTADEVAARCNVSRSRVYQWEAGDYVFPKNLAPLSSALHVPVKKLQAANGLAR